MLASQWLHCAIAPCTADSRRPRCPRTARRPSSLNFQSMTDVPFLSCGHAGDRSWKSGHVVACAHGPLVEPGASREPNGSLNASLWTVSIPMSPANEAATPGASGAAEVLPTESVGAADGAGSLPVS